MQELLCEKKSFPSNKKEKHLKKLEFKGDFKKTWDIMKELIDKVVQRRTTHPRKIILDNKTVTNKKKIAEKFNEFFSETGLSLVDKIAHAKKSFNNILKKAITALLDRPLSISELKEAFFFLKI